MKYKVRPIIPDTLSAAKGYVTQFHALAKKHGMYATDVETDGFSWLRNNVLMVQIYTKGMCLAFPVGWGDCKYSITAAVKLLRPLAEDTSIVVFFHNYKFDAHFLRNHGLMFHNQIHDTCLMGYMLDVTKPNKLKQRAPMELGIQMVEFKEKFKLGGKEKLTLLDYPKEDVAKYGCLDAYATYGLGEKYWKLGHLNGASEGVDLLYRKIDRKIVPVLFEMEREGIRVDRVALNKLRKKLTPQRQELESVILKGLAKRIQVNNKTMRSTKQLLDYFHAAGFKKLKSTNEKELQKIAHVSDVAEKLLEFRGIEKIIATYIDGIEVAMDSEDRVHTNFNQHIAATGRLSSSGDLNLQNIPRVQWMRELFVPRPGYKLIVRDYGQLELRIMAILSEDPVLIHEFNTGVDVHTLNAAKMLNKDPKDVTSEERQMAKSTTSFGVLYGMGAPSLAAMLHIDIDKAEHLINTFFSKYKLIDRWQKRVKYAAKQCGYVDTPFGRRRHIPQLHSDDRGTLNSGYRQAINTPVQGGAGDLVKGAMLECFNDNILQRCNCSMLLQVHDELVAEAPDYYAEEANERMSYLMSNFSLLKHMPVKFPTDGGWGVNWHDAKHFMDKAKDGKKKKAAKGT